MNSLTPAFLVRTAALCVVVSLAGCMTASQHRNSVRDEATSRLSVGTVQQHVRLGMSGAEVATVLGSPNIITTDEERREVWIYDKVASEIVQSSGGFSLAPFVIGTGSIRGAGTGEISHSAGATSRTNRTLTIIIKFDAQKRVRDYAFNASQF